MSDSNNNKNRKINSDSNKSNKNNDQTMPSKKVTTKNPKKQRRISNKRGPGRPPGSLNRATIARIKAEEEAIALFRQSNPDMPSTYVPTLNADKNDKVSPTTAISNDSPNVSEPNSANEPFFPHNNNNNNNNASNTSNTNADNNSKFNESKNWPHQTTTHLSNHQFDPNNPMLKPNKRILPQLQTFNNNPINTANNTNINSIHNENVRTNMVSGFPQTTQLPQSLKVSPTQPFITSSNSLSSGPSNSSAYSHNTASTNSITATNSFITSSTTPRNSFSINTIYNGKSQQLTPQQVYPPSLIKTYTVSPNNNSSQFNAINNLNLQKRNSVVIPPPQYTVVSNFDETENSNLKNINVNDPDKNKLFKNMPTKNNEIHTYRYEHSNENINKNEISQIPTIHSNENKKNDFEYENKNQNIPPGRSRLPSSDLNFVIPSREQSFSNWQYYQQQSVLPLKQHNLSVNHPNMSFTALNQPNTQFFYPPQNNIYQSKIPVSAIPAVQKNMIQQPHHHSGSGYIIPQVDYFGNKVRNDSFISNNIAWQNYNNSVLVSNPNNYNGINISNPKNINNSNNNNHSNNNLNIVLMNESIDNGKNSINTNLKFPNNPDNSYNHHNEQFQ